MPDFYLLLFGVELEALSEGAGLRLMVLLSVQIHTLSIRDVLFLSVSKQTVGIRIYAGNKSLTRPVKHVCDPLCDFNRHLFYLCRIFSLTVCQRMFNTCKHVVKKLLWHLRCWTSKNVWNDPSFLASLKFLALKFLAIHSPVELILPQTTFRKYTAV